MEDPSLISSQKVYQSRVFSLYRETFEKAGRVIEVDVVRHRGAVAVLPILGEQLILENQFRYSINSRVLEIPAGTLERGESVYECAKRELAEETGYVAEKLIRMGQIAVSPGYDDERITLFVAWLRQGERKSQQLDEDEVIQVLQMSKEEVLRKIRQGEIFDAKTVAAVLLAKELGYLRGPLATR